jgi:hypothetical protein
MATINGRIGQVCGPLPAGIDLLTDEGAIGKFTPETSKPILKKLGIQTTPMTKVKINDVEITIGKTGMYELDNVVLVKSLVFPSGADASTLVDFVY